MNPKMVGQGRSAPQVLIHLYDYQRVGQLPSSLASVHSSTQHMVLLASVCSVSGLVFNTLQTGCIVLPRVRRVKKRT